jgi:RNase P subunit RPR2
MRCVCPNCHQELNDDEYDESSEYHNAIIGHCRKCGHSTHYGYFFRE